MSGRGNVDGPWDAESRKRERERKRAAQWSLKRCLPPKKKGNDGAAAGLACSESLQPSYTVAQSA